jgi:CDP-diacylglycerol--inositol 3-phosphatidyltransferase
MPLHPRTCSILYSISCLLDALDGYAARYFEQSTKFGAVLDMVTDRCTTACLLVFLSSAFPRWAIVFQGLLSLDFASHYMHMYSSLSAGNSSHKNVDKSQSWLLNLYYTNRVGRRLHHAFVAIFNNVSSLGGAFHLLRPQRAILHRPLSPLLL